jgi:hypothetical protein
MLKSRCRSKSWQCPPPQSIRADHLRAIPSATDELVVFEEMLKIYLPIHHAIYRFAICARLSLDKVTHVSSRLLMRNITVPWTIT